MVYANNKLEATSFEAPFPAEVDVEEEVEVLLPADVELLFVDAGLPFVDVESGWLPAAMVVPPVTEAELARVADLLADEVDDDDGDGKRLEGSVTLAHERSYNGDVPKVLSLVLLPRRPKLGFGAVGAASCRTYHQVLILPKADAHPISSQNVFAFAKLGTARFSVLPLMGHPVSVIQTGLPPAAPAVALYAAQKSVYASSMLLLSVS